MFDPFFVLSILQVIWIDVLLSGDNAVVVALACQSLPPQKRKSGLALGVAFAVAMRIALASVISLLLAVPFLKVIGGILLFYIAVKVIVGEDEENKDRRPTSSIYAAIGLIVMADLTMSLDNVVAIAGAANGNDLVFIIGLLFSMPFMIIGASMVSALVARFPAIIWAGGGLLGWIAGGMIVADPYIASLIDSRAAHYPTAASGAVFVMLAARITLHLSRRARMRQVGHA